MLYVDRHSGKNYKYLDYNKIMKLLSDQIDEREIRIILHQLSLTCDITDEGDVVEFGCYVGTTSVPIAKFLKGTGRRLYVYDSFEGLPDKSREDESPAGMQFKKGELSTSKAQFVKNFKQAELPMPVITKGWFSDVSPDRLPEKIAFAYLDGDYYHSVLDPLKLIWPRLVKNAIIVVDDYSNEALPGAAKAVDEWLTRYPAKLRVEYSLAIIGPIV